MKSLYALSFILIFSIALHAQVEYDYNFNSLSIGNLDGQDDWVTILHTAGPSDMLVDYAAGSVASHDGTLAVFYNSSGGGFGRTATRKATPNFNFDFTQANTIEMEIDMYRNYWGMFFGAGFDADGDGHIAPGLVTEPNDGGIYVNISAQNPANNKIVLPDGNSVSFNVANDGWCRYKMVLDFTANNGEGAVALSYDPGITGTWIAVTEVQGVNMGLTPGSGNKQDRTVWDGIFFHSQGATGGFDDITIREPENNGLLQFIDFTAIPNKLTTDPPFILEATATSGLPVVFEITDGPATLNGNTVTLTGVAGFVTIKASQQGDPTWAPAPDVFQTFEVVDATAYSPDLTIRRPADNTKVYMAELNPILIVASAYIEHPEVLSITGVSCIVDGQTIFLTEKTWNTGYYSAEWTPSTFGNYSMTINATSTGGMVSSGTVTFEVTNEVSDLTVQAFDHTHISTSTSTSVTQDFVFPTYVGSFDQIMAYLDVTCPSGGCDAWDRVGNMEAKGPTGEWVEIFRYITPYGVPCDHSLDATDYASIFQGLVEMRFSIGTDAQGFIVDVTFGFHEGIPQYKYSWVDVIWRGTFPFGDYASMQPMDTIIWDFEPEVEASKLKIINTGHGWGDLNTGNAAEFYNATHKIKVNGTEFDQHLLVTCNPNPDGCQPQNGTWYFNRAGWCPGSISYVYEYDLTPFVNVSDVELVYEFYPGYVDYCHPNHPDCITGVTCSDCNSGFNPHYIIAGNLISYTNTLYIPTGEIELNHIGLQLTPNPAADFVLLSTNLKNASLSATVRILSVSGQLMKQFTWEGNDVTLDISELPVGLYVVIVEAGENREIKKLVIL
ncbi:MAG: T9SS type A sorting domain-containing protein [Bacteroidales bacterium]|nr:T9SS type A sorting domain-containing protein [Bacteroidales bacterium]